MAVHAPRSASGTRWPRSFGPAEGRTQQAALYRQSDGYVSLGNTNTQGLADDAAQYGLGEDVELDIAALSFALGHRQVNDLLGLRAHLYGAASSERVSLFGNLSGDLGSVGPDDHMELVVLASFIGTRDE